MALWSDLELQKSMLMVISISFRNTAELKAAYLQEDA